MAYNTQNVTIGVCRVLYDDVDLGLTKGGVEVEVQSETYKVEVDQYGKTPINEIIMGRTISVKVPLAETTLDNLVATMPGATLVQNGGTKASGTITVSTNPVANDTIVVNGVTFTFKASATTPLDIAIGAAANNTATNIAAVLTAYSDPRVSIAKYSVATNVVTVTYEEYGTGGNAFTLAKTGTGITVSGATLSGGVAATKLKVIVPTGVGVDLLSVAKKLVLHPTAKADSDKSRDLIIPKAATSGSLQFAYKLDSEQIFNVTFNGYPDTTGNLFVLGDESTT